MSQPPINYKEETKRTYNLYPADFDTKFEKHFHKNVKHTADLFISHLPGKTILDLGCGPGNHGVYFKEQGLDALCGDLSEEMVRLCQQKGLKSQIVDIENIDFPAQSFDGIWAYASLLHVPKDRMPAVVQDITGLLKPNGLLALAVKEGKGEGMETHEKYPGTQRWFTYFTDKEIKALFSQNFDLLAQSATPVSPRYNFLDYLFRIKEKGDLPVTR